MPVNEINPLSSTCAQSLPPQTTGLLVLAPMEGLADAPMRQVLLQRGGFDWTVSEFIRVTNQLLPKHVFYSSCPELLAPTATPLRIQLLGNHADALAANAERALELGSFGVDLNFGCPSKTVNKSCGGAALLKEPQLIEQLIARVRQSVPAPHILSAKIRLGYHSIEEADVIYRAAVNGGADQIVVHARTKEQGYRPPAFWWRLAELAQQQRILTVINGEIWQPEHYWQARWQSHCQHAMLGRGMISDPDLVHKIRAMQQGRLFKPRTWQQLCPDLSLFIALTRARTPEKNVAGRLKQWLKHLSRHWPQAEHCLALGKPMSNVDDILALAHSQAD